MTSAVADAPGERSLTAGRASYLTIARTVGSWLATTDHKRIGVLYLFSTSSSPLALGGVFALLLRIEHLTPGRPSSTRIHLQPPVHDARRRRWCGSS
jgi:hypothetical protein